MLAKVAVEPQHLARARAGDKRRRQKQNNDADKETREGDITRGQLKETQAIEG